MADFKLPVAPIFDGESFELDGDIIKGKDGGAEPDDATIELNADGKLQIKDEGVSLEKMATIDTSHAGEFYKVGDDGRPTFGKVEPDNATIELNASDELQVKDRGITLEKMARQTAHVNEVYMTDATGYPTLGEVMPKFRFDNTRETSEGLTIPDIDETTFQDICNFVNEGKPVIVEYDTLATPIKHTIFIGSKYDEWSASDCLAVSFIGDDLVRWFYDDEETGAVTAKKIIKDVAVAVDGETIQFNSDNELECRTYTAHLDKTSSVSFSSISGACEKIAKNLYWFSITATLTTSASIPANAETKVFSGIKFDNKVTYTYTPLTGVYATISAPMGAVLYPAGAAGAEIYVNSPNKISGGQYFVVSGFVTTVG